jgi:hypothetical protein
VRITYTGKENGRKYDELHVLDIDSLAHRVEFGKKDIEDLVKEVEKIAKVLDDKFNKIESHLELANAIDSHSFEVRPLRHLISEIQAWWMAAKSIKTDQHARFAWEPTLLILRSMSFNAILAAARESAPDNFSETILKVLKLLYVPTYLRKETYAQELDQAIQELSVILRPTDCIES